MRSSPLSFAAVLGLFTVLYSIPFAAPVGPYTLQILSLALCYAVSAIGLNLLFGYTGLVSVGHMGFAGVGGYVAALLMKYGSVGFVPALAAGAVCAGAAGVVIGAPCLRLRSHFFIIVTLALSIILYTLFNNLDAVTGGAEGLPGIPRPSPFHLGVIAVDFRLPNGFYWLALTTLATIFILQYLIVNSDFGRSLAAIRQDETVAAARGVNVFAHKLVVFGISTAIAGLGGGLTVTFLRVAAPSSFDLAESINLVMIVILGGAGSLFGPLAGAALFIVIPEVLRLAQELRLVAFGAMLVLLALYWPRGVCGLAVTLKHWLSMRAPPNGRYP